MAEDPDKVTKASVDYSPGKPATHCGNCKHFIAKPDSYGDYKCERVAGGIKWNYWCKLWRLK